ncbi:hypothetical protein J2Z66_005286 [Paenibacillus eucommiae]|uniref:Uncharacterized protein n=1 Tax=Paenibacillus eucommiae TaxID=1355755 RepID=A0ABS4J1I2_9BACL|nr:hypothetical protein [Paenibacillus eucommiae]
MGQLGETARGRLIFQPWLPLRRFDAAFPEESGEGCAQEDESRNAVDGKRRNEQCDN